MDLIPSKNARIPQVKFRQESRLGDLIFGSVSRLNQISGFTGKIVEYPFDTIKVHLQTQEKQSFGNCIRNIVKSNGAAGFFTGISAPLIGSMVENAVLFLAYNQIQKFIRKSTGMKEWDPLTIGQLCVAGGISGAVVSFILTPVELLKCRLQTQGFISSRTNHSGPLSILFHTLKTSGVTGLYQGHTCTLLREVAGGVAWFGIYELSVERMIKESSFAKSKKDLTPWQLMGAGAIAGMGYNAALYPADVVKSRIQSGLHGSDGFIAVSKNIYKTQGYRGFFRGFVITIARSAPSSGVIFLTYVFLID